jgi:hypothetical protein
MVVPGGTGAVAVGAAVDADGAMVGWAPAGSGPASQHSVKNNSAALAHAPHRLAGTGCFKVLR